MTYSIVESSLSTESLSTAEKSRETWIRIPAKRPHTRALYLTSWLLNALLLFSFLWVRRSFSGCDAASEFSPAQHVLEHQIIAFNEGQKGSESTYQGNPTPEHDQLWEDLYGFGISRIPMSVATKLPQQTAPLAGDPGYFITELSVFHQLRCLDVVRLRLWSNATSDDPRGPVEMDRVSDCLEEVRQALMCGGDIAAISWHWDHKDSQLMPVPNVRHSCRNFDKIREWAKENQAMSVDGRLYPERHSTL